VGLDDPPARSPFAQAPFTGTHRRPRAASPALPRRRSRSAAPEVPFIGERAGQRREPLSPDGTSPPDCRIGTSPIFRPGWFCPQSVANLWTTSGAFGDLAGTAALDGATGRRPGGIQQEKNPHLRARDRAEARRPSTRAPSALTNFYERKRSAADFLKIWSGFQITARRHKIIRVSRA